MDKIDIVPLSQVPDPGEDVFMSSGINGLDLCLAAEDGQPGGIAKGTSVLLSGVPGGGKSTIALSMAAAAKAHGDVLYFYGEEPKERIKKRNIRLGNLADPFMMEMSGEFAEASFMAEAIRELQPALVIVDSVQYVAVGGRRGDRVHDEAVQILKKVCAEVKTTILFISHVTKAGQHAGRMTIAHEVDCHLHIALSAAKGERRIEIRKNRYGRAGFSADLHLLGSGASIDAQSVKQGLAEARGKVEHAASVAEDMLMKGATLTGYDFDEAGTSAGVWRAGLEVAVRRLQKQGVEVLETKVKGRKAYSVPAAVETNETSKNEPMTQVGAIEVD